MFFVWMALALALCAVVYLLGRRIDPTMVSRDGRRMFCLAQVRDASGAPAGRWRETRLMHDSGPDFLLERRRLIFLRTLSGWVMRGESTEEAPKRKAIFLLDGFARDGAPAILAVRVPDRGPAFDLLSATVPGGHARTQPEANRSRKSRKGDAI